MSPKQKKIAAKAPPKDKIDAKDFAVLKAEKAKGRGMGLQDESIKPGKVQKAFLGKMIKGAGKSIGRLFGKKKSATATPGAATMSGSGKGMGGMLPKLLQKAIDDGIIKPASKGRMMKASKGGESKSDKVKRAFPEKSPSGRAKIETMLGSKYTPMKRERLFAGSAARRKEGFKKLLKNVRKAIPGVGMLDVKVTKNSKGGGADMSKNKKSKSGSSVKDIFKSYGKYDGKPIELSKGGGADTGTRGEIRSKLSVAADRFKRRMSQMPGKITDEERKKIKELLKDVKPARPARPMPNIKSDGPKRLMPSRPKPSLGPMARRMGGGMINKPMGYKKGASIMARGCKLGRKKTTKLY